MFKPFTYRLIILLLLTNNSLMACSAPKSDQQSEIVAGPQPDFNESYRILTHSCMPCHNKQTLPEVIRRLKASSTDSIDGEKRLRILSELEELQHAMKEGLPISFTDEKELLKFFAATPGEFYVMLEKGVMPPPWAEPLFKEIQWPNYKPLAFEDRVRLLQYAKPHSEKYIR